MGTNNVPEWKRLGVPEFSACPDPDCWWCRGINKSLQVIQDEK